jgi:hypothetical protein
MNVVLWILQVLLALAFLAGGAMKVSKPRTELATRLGWPEDFSDTTVKVIGGLEVLAGLALILPSVLDVVPVLTALAASGIVLLTPPRPPGLRVPDGARDGGGEQPPRGLRLPTTIRPLGSGGLIAALESATIASVFQQRSLGCGSFGRGARVLGFRR